MNYYDEEFKPWETVDGRCVVADEAVWNRLIELNALREPPILDMPANDVAIVKVPTDIFEDVEGPVQNSSGGQLFRTETAWNVLTGFPFGVRELAVELSVDHMLPRFFQAIDSTQHVDYLLMTQRPELVREKWDFAYPPHSEDWPRTNGEKMHRRNVILATYAETQADIERLIPELLKCHDLCKGLAVICNPKEELSFSCYGDELMYPIDLIIAEGNEHPIHPQWLRSLREQCKYASVKFNFASWGEYQHGASARPEYHCHVFQPDGPWMEKVGKSRSGRTLDGQEHNGRIA